MVTGLPHSGERSRLKKESRNPGSKSGVANGTLYWYQFQLRGCVCRFWFERFAPAISRTTAS